MNKFIEELSTVYEYIKSNSFTKFYIHKNKKNSIIFFNIRAHFFKLDQYC